MDDLIQKYVRPEKIPGTACRGCGLRIAHRKVLEAVHELELGLGDLVWGTGIGCSGRQTFATWKGDTFAGTHGRVYAMATGLRLALPAEKKILLTVGDGDAFTIGFLHLLNCARRNVDMTVVVLDNLGYQSTGGQYGLTTPLGSRTDSSPTAPGSPTGPREASTCCAFSRRPAPPFWPGTPCCRGMSRWKALPGPSEIPASPWSN